MKLLIALWNWTCRCGTSNSNNSSVCSNCGNSG